jgi:hypothetical protein
VNLPDLATTVSGIFAVLAGIAGIWRHIEKRQNQFELAQQHITDKLDFIQAQFGPNGGGIRQAVNEMASKIDKLQERQITIGDKIARLEGEFTQHLNNN